MNETTPPSRHGILKVEPWRSEAEHTTFRSRGTPQYWIFTNERRKSILFLLFKTWRPEWGSNPWSPTFQVLKIIPVRMVKCMNDLGVSVVLDLLCNTLLNTVVCKCSRIKEMLKRYVCYKAPITVTSYLYSVLICSNLEHCSTLWFSFNFVMKCKH